MQTAIAYLVAARRCEIAELEQLNRTCELMRVVSEFVQNLQSERGISNVYIASEGQRFGARREQSCALTDRSREFFLLWLARNEPSVSIAGGSRLFTRIAQSLHSLDELGSIRSSVQSLAGMPAESSERYSHLISTLLALVFDAADIAVDPEVSRLLVALFNLMQGKEFVGQERAIGSRSFATGLVSPEDLRAISDAIELQEQCFQRFESFCGESLLAQWQALQSIMPLVAIERMRRRLFMPVLQADGSLAEEWFNCCSDRIDHMYVVEQHLTAQLELACQSCIKRTQTELQDHQVLLAAFEKQISFPVRTELVAGLSSGMHLTELLGLASVGSPLTRDVFTALQKQSRHLQSVSEELASVRAALEERKVVERAKGVLMSTQSITEPVAYRLLRDKAMNQNRRMIDVAESVLAMADFLPKK